MLSFLIIIVHFLHWNETKELLFPLKGKTKFTRILKPAFVCIIYLGIIPLDVDTAMHLILQREVNRQLGFNHATPEENEGEIFLITEIESGNAMDRSGLKAGDRVSLVGRYFGGHAIAVRNEWNTSTAVLIGEEKINIRLLERVDRSERVFSKRESAKPVWMLRGRYVFTPTDHRLKFGTNAQSFLGRFL